MSHDSTKVEAHVLAKYSIIKKVGSGAYGHVWKVEERATKKVLALKKIFDAFQHSTDAQRTYREIQILKQTDHPNIIKLYETMPADNNRDVYLVFEFMEADLHNVIAEGILKEVHIRFIVYQVAKALKYLHSGAIIHRDLKPSNILVNSDCKIKLCDFGLVRSLHGNQDNNAVLTEGVATRWYRAPEVLLGSKCYSTPADVWSYGCIIFEILAQKPFFPGNSTVEQIQKIIHYTGSPNEEDIKSIQSDVALTMIKEAKLSSFQPPQWAKYLKDFPPMFSDLLQKMMIFNPKKRLTIEQILDHEVVQPFRKKQTEISCTKIIKTSIDDNKKLTVDEYRTMVYGRNRMSSLENHKLSSLGVKKSASFTKFSTHNNPSSFSSQGQKQEKVTAPLRYVKSKEALKTLHTFNKSSEVKGSDSISSSINSSAPIKKEQPYSFHSHNHIQQQYAKKQYTRDPTRVTYINKNFYSPKYSGESSATTTTTTTTTTTSTANNVYNSPKLSSYMSSMNKQRKPLFKSSKHLLMGKNEETTTGK